MKKYVTLVIVFCFIFTYIQAQNTYLWPIAGAKSGTGIISKPQSYIDKEFNFSNLFIAAPEGATVVSPVNGTIIHVGTIYSISLISTSSGEVRTTFDAAIADFRKELDKQCDPQYVSGALSIRATDGKVIHINGLSGKQTFKTGQKITRGMFIGQVAYSYRPLKEPSIEVSIDQNGRVSDPMTPFGLKTTYIAPAAIKPIAFLTKQQLKEDFLLYIDVLKECYPGLSDVITPEELDRYVERTKTRIDARAGDWPFVSVSELFMEAVAKIHDSHIYMLYPEWYDKLFKFPNQAQVSLAWLSDTLICRNASTPYKFLLNRPIEMVNGVPAEQLKQRIAGLTGSYDGGVQSVKESAMARIPIFFDLAPGSTTFDYNMRLQMADKKEVVTVPAAALNAKLSFSYTLEKYAMINNHKEGYKTKMLNDSTAYIGMTSFGFNQVQMEEIARFIDSIAKVPHLIIDVRNNGGGSFEVLSKLYSYIAGEPMTLHGYSRVNKQGGYHSFAHSLNHSVEDSLFADYRPEAGKEGFYSHSETGNEIRPDSITNYKGKVYVLTNAGSISAAASFPALLVRNHRGVVVGRETCTAYHFMNAARFASIRLPHSTLTINVPLVHCRFDTVENKRVPYGRGVLPDYEVPITLNELSFKNGDAILNYTLQLIKEGKYLSKENPFAN